MYYKVVKKSGLRSARTSERGFTTYYKVGEWISSPFKGSKLFVFDDLGQAKNFMYGFFAGADEEIYECEVKGVYKGRTKFLATFSDFSTFTNLWKNFRNKKRFSQFINTFGYKSNVVNNTVWVDEVKLIKKVG